MPASRSTGASARCSQAIRPEAFKPSSSHTRATSTTAITASILARSMKNPTQPASPGIGRQLGLTGAPSQSVACSSACSRAANSSPPATRSSVVGQMAGPARRMICCSTGSACMNRIRAENTVTCAVLSCSAGTSTNSSMAACQTPISTPASSAKASSDGRPYQPISGANAGASAAITPVSSSTWVTSITGTMMRTSSQ